MAWIAGPTTAPAGLLVPSLSCFILLFLPLYVSIAQTSVLGPVLSLCLLLGRSHTAACLVLSPLWEQQLENTWNLMNVKAQHPQVMASGSSISRL